MTSAPLADPQAPHAAALAAAWGAIYPARAPVLSPLERMELGAHPPAEPFVAVAAPRARCIAHGPGALATVEAALRHGPWVLCHYWTGTELRPVSAELARTKARRIAAGASRAR